MLPDEVREAVERIEFRLRGVWEPQADVHSDFAAIKAHLLAREAEVERLEETLAHDRERWNEAAHDAGYWDMRCERAEALLRECLAVMDLHPATHDRITARLQEQDRG